VLVLRWARSVDSWSLFVLEYWQIKYFIFQSLFNWRIRLTSHYALAKYHFPYCNGQLEHICVIEWWKNSLLMKYRCPEWRVSSHLIAKFIPYTATESTTTICKAACLPQQDGMPFCVVLGFRSWCAAEGLIHWRNLAFLIGLEYNHCVNCLPLTPHLNTLFSILKIRTCIWTYSMFSVLIRHEGYATSLFKIESVIFADAIQKYNETSPSLTL
jgi:hypothetical protein